MLNTPTQVSVNQTEYLPPLKKGKHGKHREGYFAFYYQNHRAKYQTKTQQKDRHQLDFKTRHWVRFLKQENYLLISLKELLVLSGCETYISLIINNKNLFFYRCYSTEPCYLEKQKDFLFSHLIWREQEQLNHFLNYQPRQFRKKWQEIKTKVEILSQWNHPTKLVPGYKENGRPKPTWEGTGWNSPNYWEPKNRSLAALAFTHEIVLGKIGTDTPLLDLDPNKKDKEGNYKIKQEWLRKALVVGGKKWKALINKHQIPYYWKTATPGNSLLPLPFWLVGTMVGRKIYHQDMGQEIGDLLGVGDLVALPVGGDKKRQLVITDWGKKLVKKYGTEGILRKNFLAGDIEEKVEEVLNGVFLSLDKTTIQKSKNRKIPKIREHLAKNQVENTGNKKISMLELSISGKLKTSLKDIWKVFYKDSQQKLGYFLVNDYQRERDFNNLEIGSALNICLVQGYRHQFLSHLC